MAGKAEPQQAGEAVARYHEAMLGVLLEHVAATIDRYRDGELDAFQVDRIMFQYSRAAKELWKFCNMGHVEFTASHVHDDPPIDWWECGAPSHCQVRRRKPDRGFAPRLRGGCLSAATGLSGGDGCRSRYGLRFWSRG